MKQVKLFNLSELPHHDHIRNLAHGIINDNYGAVLAYIVYGYYDKYIEAEDKFNYSEDEVQLDFDISTYMVAKGADSGETVYINLTK